MRMFKVYQHPTRGFEAVKVGFSWPACFGGIIWMLVKKLWRFAGLWFALAIVLNLVEAVTDEARSKPGLQAIVYLLLAAGYFAWWLVPAVKGNLWRSKNLEKRGYELVNTIQAETPDAAIAQLARAT